jgi:hypothetical protein
MMMVYRLLNYLPILLVEDIKPYNQLACFGSNAYKINDSSIHQTGKAGSLLQ